MSESNVRRLVEKLSRMRGAALKLGQFLSIQGQPLPRIIYIRSYVYPFRLEALTGPDRANYDASPEQRELHAALADRSESTSPTSLLELTGFVESTRFESRTRLGISLLFLRSHSLRRRFNWTGPRRRLVSLFPLRCSVPALGSSRHQGAISWSPQVDRE